MWRHGWLLAALSLCAAKRYNLTVGYLPCITGEPLEKQGLTISGALSLALEELNNSTELLPDVEVLLEWHDSKCEAATSTRLLSDMLDHGVVALFGPERHYHAAATIAQARNLPMISYSCGDCNHETSRLSNFIQLDPTVTQAPKAVLSLLRYYRWHKFSIIYEDWWTMTALSLKNYAQKNNMTAKLKPINNIYMCCKYEQSCCSNSYLRQFVRDFKNDTRIFVYLGSKNGLKDLMTTMESLQLFATGLYMVIFVNTMVPSSKSGLEYLVALKDIGATFQCPSSDSFTKRASSLLVVTLAEPPLGHADFAQRVRRYNTLDPFKFPDSFGNKFVSIYGAYLYDAVMLYARALDELIKEDVPAQLTRSALLDIATNGSRIAQRIIRNSPYISISGMPIRLSENGELEGNFSLLAYRPDEHVDDMYCSYAMIPVGQFLGRAGRYPEYKLNLPIEWAGGGRPDDEPLSDAGARRCAPRWSLLMTAALPYILFL